MRIFNEKRLMLMAATGWYASGQIASTPADYNCESLSDELQVRWQVQENEIAFELVGLIDDDVYMAFGISGSDNRTFMVGADATVADVFDGEFRARDIYLSGRSPCSDAGTGVCPDSTRSFTNDASEVSGLQESGVTLVRFKRSWVPTDVNESFGGQPVDRPIAVEPGVSTFVLWALGPVQASGLPGFHSIDFPRVDVRLEFGRPVQDNCIPLVEVTPSPTPPPPPLNIGETPADYNCEPLSNELQVRWQVQDDEIAFELVGLIDDDVYMGFGVSGSDTRTLMVGADATVADLIDGEFRARDFYLSGRSPCNDAGTGVCPDPTSSFTNDASEVSGLQESGATLIRFKRPLVPTDVNGSVGGQSVDRPIVVEPGVSTFVVWALGPMQASGLPGFHSIDFPRDDVSIEFGRTVQNNCQNLVEATPSPTPLPPPPPPGPGIGVTPDAYNCEALSEEFQVRWQVQDDAIAFELLGLIDDNVYMGFGISGSETQTFMVGADATIADVFNGTYRARDFYMSARNPCLDNGAGVCPDSVSLFNNDVSEVSGLRESGATLVRFKRPLTPTDVVGSAGGQPVDKIISLEPGVTTFVVWAVGPVEDETGLPLFHSIDFPREDVSLEFGRNVQDNCEPLVDETPPPPIPEIAITPENYNCEPLSDAFQVRWQIQDGDIALELVGLIDDDVYMGFGISGSDSQTFMVGADATVVDVFDGTFRARDFYMSARNTCTDDEAGVCPDPASSFNNDASEVSGLQDSGATLVRFRRPLNPTDVGEIVGGQPIDKTISSEPGVSTFIVWALGPIQAETGLPLFHSIDFPREDVSLEFGRAVQDNCLPLVGGTPAPAPETEAPELEPFFRPPLVETTDFVAHIGPSGGERGVEGITDQPSFVVAWYLNDLLIPLVEMRRGTTYTFRVNGGDDSEVGADYHPLYLTTSSTGGYNQRTPEERLDETILAGLDIIDEANGGFEVLAAGPLCLYATTDDTEASLVGTYDEFFASLDTSCSDDTSITNEAAVLEFTPDQNTPDLIYYQCVTHSNLGFEIRVIDEDAPSIVDVDCSNPTAVELGDLSISAIVDPVAATLTAEVTYNGIGWIAMGFTNGAAVMVGSEAVIGLPDEPNGPTNPGKYNLNARQVSGVVLMPEAQQTLINATIEQTVSQTIMRFSKLLVEPGEHPISASAENTFLFAYGSDNELDVHQTRGGFSVQLSQCAVSVDGELLNAEFVNGGGVALDSNDPNRSLFVAHGACAATAWAILVPLAIGSSLIRKTLEYIGLPKGAWFKLHRGLNVLAVVLTITAFSLAVHGINQQPDPEHFSLTTHHKLGLVIFILTLLQALGGIFRPHLPEPIEIHELDEEGSEIKTSKLVPEERSPQRRSFDVMHRLLGTALVGMAWWQVQDGFGLFATIFTEENIKSAFWGVVGGICGFFLIVLVYEKAVLSKRVPKE